MASARRIRLLVVDDSALMRKLLTELFEAEGDFEVRTAREGTEAIAQVHAFAPDVVTLDVNMPGLDGLSCLARIMVEAPRPVVMVSALTAEGAAATLEAMHLGAVDFVAKPEGIVSLGFQRIAAALVAKVRTAATAKPRASASLTERVRHQMRQAAALPPGGTAPDRPPWPPAAAGEPPGIVLVGASTGGPRALEIVLTGLPGDFAWAVLVAQHMPRPFTTAFAGRLDGRCALPVTEVTRPTMLAPGRIHIAQGDADMIVVRRPGGLAALSAPPSPRYRWHPSVDRLVASALEQVDARRLVGVLLTGMGDDGAATMAALRAGGGRTIAEDEASAVVWGMPGELVRRGGAEAVLPVERIADALLAMVG